MLHQHQQVIHSERPRFQRSNTMASSPASLGCEWPYEPRWSLNGFRFCNISASDNQRISPNFYGRDFTSSALASTTNSRVEDFSLRVSNNIAVQFRAMLFLGNYYKASHFWKHVAMCALNRGAANAEEVAEIFVAARKAYLQRRKDCPNETARLVDEWIIFLQNRQESLPVPQAIPWHIYQKWLQMGMRGELLDAGHPHTQQPTTTDARVPQAAVLGQPSPGPNSHHGTSGSNSRHHGPESKVKLGLGAASVSMLPPRPPAAAGSGSKPAKRKREESPPPGPAMGRLLNHEAHDKSVPSAASAAEKGKAAAPSTVATVRWLEARSARNGEPNIRLNQPAELAAGQKTLLSDCRRAVDNTSREVRLERARIDELFNRIGDLEGKLTPIPSSSDEDGDDFTPGGASVYPQSRRHRELQAQLAELTARVTALEESAERSSHSQADQRAPSFAAMDELLFRLKKLELGHTELQSAFETSHNQLRVAIELDRLACERERETAAARAHTGRTGSKTADVGVQAGGRG
ncbi:hypothetical protein VTK26DRAFT_5490 [Humicola hyalothermophila]